MDARRRTLTRKLCIAAALSVALTGAGASAALAASDPLFDEQWAIADPDAIGASSAWTSSSGAGVIVAVLDSGIQLDHPDLADSLWVNKGEVPGNGRDDDANGIVDDVHGANMFDASANVWDDNGHGTHVAGIVAARRGNGAGGTGIAPAATIMPVKVLDADMSGNTRVLAAGIRYAVNKGARILNISINGDESTGDLANAVKYASDRGATIVASSGNNARNIDAKPSYPASLPDPAVLTVTATGPVGALWHLANLGAQTVDLAAPGEHILSTSRSSAYSYRAGTSAAAPFVAGSLALLAAVRPDLPQSALREVLLSSGRQTSGLSAAAANGHLDVGAAMDRLLPGRPKGGLTAAAASTAPRLRMTLGAKRIRAGRRATLRWRATDAGEVSAWRVSLDGRRLKVVPAADPLTASRRIGEVGRHRWRVEGFDRTGAKVVSATRSFRVLRRR